MLEGRFQHWNAWNNPDIVRSDGEENVSGPAHPDIESVSKSLSHIGWIQGVIGDGMQSQQRIWLGKQGRHLHFLALESGREATVLEVGANQHSSSVSIFLKSPPDVPNCIFCGAACASPYVKLNDGRVFSAYCWWKYLGTLKTPENKFETPICIICRRGSPIGWFDTIIGNVCVACVRVGFKAIDDLQKLEAEILRRTHGANRFIPWPVHFSIELQVEKQCCLCHQDCDRPYLPLDDGRSLCAECVVHYSAQAATAWRSPTESHHCQFCRLSTRAPAVLTLMGLWCLSCVSRSLRTLSYAFDDGVVPNNKILEASSKSIDLRNSLNSLSALRDRVLLEAGERGAPVATPAGSPDWPMTSLDFIEANCATDKVHSLLATYQKAIESSDLPPAGVERIRQYAHFAERNAHLLSRDPASVFQLAINEPESTAPYQDAERLLESALEARPFLRWINRPYGPLACRRRLLVQDSLMLTNCACSPDGAQILVGGDFGLLKIFDARTGAVLMEFPGLEKGIWSCAFSPEGEYVVAGGEDKVLKIYHARTGSLQATLTGHTDSITVCRYSPDGRHIASTSFDNTLRLWNPANGNLEHVIEGKDLVWACDFSPDSLRIVSGLADGTLSIWDANTGALLASHETLVRLRGCAWAPDGASVLAVLSDNTLEVWDLKAEAIVLSLRGTTPLEPPSAFSRDGRRIISVRSNNSIEVWEARTGELLATLTGHTDTIRSCCDSPDGKQILSGADDGTVRIWDLEYGMPVVRWPEHKRKVSACRFSPAANQLVSSADSELKVWDAFTGAHLATLLGHSEKINCCSYSSDGSFIISGSNDMTTRVWDALIGQQRMELSGHEHPVQCCVYSPDGDRILSAGGTPKESGELKLWDARGQLLMEFGEHADAINACRFSPNGRWILSCSDDTTLVVWDVETGASAVGFVGHSAAVVNCDYSPDGRFVLSACQDGSAMIWDAQQGDALISLSANSPAGKPCVFSPDGRRIIGRLTDDRIGVYDPFAQTIIAELSGPSERTTLYAFSPDGTLILTTTEDALRLWDSERGTLVATFYANSKITTAEFSNAGDAIVAGDEGAQLYLLQLVDIMVKPPLVIPLRRYHAASRSWDHKDTIACLRCGLQFLVDSSGVVVGSLTSDAPPTMLSSLVDCPGCGFTLNCCYGPR